jgi:hypothetical protein
MITSSLVFDQALGLFDDHLGNLHVARRRLVEGRGNHFAHHGALHLGHFFRALVDQQHDQEGIRRWLAVIALAMFCRITVLPAARRRGDHEAR